MAVAGPVAGAGTGPGACVAESVSSVRVRSGRGRGCGLPPNVNDSSQSEVQSTVASEESPVSVVGRRAGRMPPVCPPNGWPWQSESASIRIQAGREAEEVKSQYGPRCADVRTAGRDFTCICLDS